MKELSIYIHIPFCVRKCLYCDFLSFPVSGTVSRIETPSALCAGSSAEEKIKHYVNLIKKELVRESVKYRQHQVISVFWGGGTPSLLSGNIITDVMEIVRKNYRMEAGAEITMEMNPGTADAQKLRQYVAAGINRLSIGLQSADDSELARIGRIHDYRTFLNTYDAAEKAGFRNINIDLMSALPGQSAASYEQTLKRVIALLPEHISAYSLILEEGTPLYERRADYLFPTEEEEQEMDRLTREVLASGGYHRYEISNYALEGYECRHNKVYWQRGDYAGFGLGASSMVGNVRWSNPAEMEHYRKYVEQPGVEADVCGEVGTVQGKVQAAETAAEYVPARQILTTREQMEEFMFLGLRMVNGVSEEKFERTFGLPMETVYGDVLAGLYRQGLLLKEQNRIRLTERGMEVGNYAMAQFLFN